MKRKRLLVVLPEYKRYLKLNQKLKHIKSFKPIFNIEEIYFWIYILGPYILLRLFFIIIIQQLVISLFIFIRGFFTKDSYKTL